MDIDVERRVDVPGEAPQQRRGHGGVVDEIDVTLAAGRAPRVEAGVDVDRVDDANVRG
jgi:hypothetical protein